MSLKETFFENISNFTVLNIKKVIGLEFLYDVNFITKRFHISIQTIIINIDELNKLLQSIDYLYKLSNGDYYNFELNVFLMSFEPLERNIEFIFGEDKFCIPINNETLRIILLNKKYSKLKNRVINELSKIINFCNSIPEELKLLIELEK